VDGQDAATRIDRACRTAGITLRGMVDCVIVSVARRHRATLLAHDAGLDRVAGFVVDDASRLA
jgi:predicted nucleic acid-binding protein